MAQQIKLKRSAVAGKVPTTGSLAAGELAINTVDGKLYFKRDDDTVQSIVTTNALITGSININGPVTASFFKGDGTAVTGVVTSSYASTAPFSGITGKPTLVSGSAQIDLSQATGIAANATSASYAVTASYVAAGGIDGTVAYAQNTVTTGKNISGASIPKGTPLYFTGSGTSGNLVGILPADAGNPARMPAGGIAGEAIADGAEGAVLLNGYISEVDTTGFTPGTEVFVAVGGGYTSTPPTGSALVQKLGNVEKSAINGSGVINGPGAARSVPNILTGYTWVGDSNGVATPTAVSTLSVASAVSASHALTASAVNTLSQNVTIVGNLEVFGTSSFTSVTSSQLVVDDSFIGVNVFEPAERFGGLKVYDSGSLSHLATASLAWDSLHNHWVYQNASGSTYTGGMFLSGPRNTGSLGDEPNLAKWFVPRSDGGDHLENSQIFSSGSTTIITGSLTTTGKATIGTVDNYGADPDKFLAIVAGEVVYRTGAELLSDIGGQTSGTFVQNAGSGGQARYIMRYADSNSATTSSIYEDTSGRIGIKTTTPSYPLDVSGSFRASSNSNIVGFIKSTSAFGATISYQDTNTSGNDWVSAGAVGNSFVIATGLQVKAIVDVDGHTYPNSDKLQDLGSGLNRWRTVYTDDIDASDTVTAGALDVKGNAIVSGSLTIKGTTTVVQEGILVSGTTSLTVASINTGSYEGAFLDYVITSGSNKRAGTLTVVWTASDVEWNDASTLDLGTTAGAEFTPTLAGSNANLVLAVPAGTWTVKGHLRYM